ncbi:AzlC family ABC transporter permease [Nocardioides convexus]|uniref:AzlC family ABC transporter permease n=1 Tax=Nocardioides convexus TaxID=2712224 RepID=UPI00241877F9|nr:AzlC family ABC transporter permease [Nocardioides convexus]
MASGLSVAQTCVLSLLMFTGASQFALAGVLGAGGSAVSGALTALLLGTRNTLYGLRMAPLLGYRGWRRAAAAHVLIDESTAMAVNRPDRDLARTGFWTTGVTIFVLWNLATCLGAVAGEQARRPARPRSRRRRRRRLPRPAVAAAHHAPDPGDGAARGARGRRCGDGDPGRRTGTGGGGRRRPGRRAAAR